MFHAGTAESTRTKIMSELQSEERIIRVLICTTALGYGVNIRNCQNVVFHGIPHSITDFVQEVGRVGRNGSQAVCVVLSDASTNKQSDLVLVDALTGISCIRSALEVYFYAEGGPTQSSDLLQHNCCGNCCKLCRCGSCVESKLETMLTDCINRLEPKTADCVTTVLSESDSDAQSLSSAEHYTINNALDIGDFSDSE